MSQEQLPHDSKAEASQLLSPQTNRSMTATTNVSTTNATAPPAKPHTHAYHQSNKSMQYPTVPRYGNNTLFNPEELVKETHRISIDYNPINGRKTLNTYEIVRELGRGEHGKVKLGYDRERHIYAAIKLLNRKEKPKLGRPQGSSTEEKIHREIAILKKCRHPNIVRLLEVLDDDSSRKVYLVLEYCAKGEIRWQNSRGEPVLCREQTRSVAQNVVLGLEYLHLNGIIHRDIKPANLLVSQDDMVKISDFGVSYAVTQEAGMESELELSKTVGTPAFFSPELCIPTEFNDNGERKTPHINAKVDVWAFGVTLYCLLYGRLPFEADNEYELFGVIANDPVYFPASNDEDLIQANELVSKLLTKDPKKRPTISEIKHHPWMLKGLNSTQKSGFLDTTERKTINVSNEEVNEAIRGVSFKTRIKQGFSKFVEQMRTHKGSSSHSSAPSTTSSNRSIATSKSSKTALDSSARVTPYSSGSLKDTINNSHHDISSHSDSNLSLSSVVSVISSAADSDTPCTEDNSTPIGLMPMQLEEDNSLVHKMPSIDNLNIRHSRSNGGFTSGYHHFNHSNHTVREDPTIHNIHLQPSVLTDIPRINDDRVYQAEESSGTSSSSDEEYGELTLVVGRNRSRSIEASGRTALKGHTSQ